MLLNLTNLKRPSFKLFEDGRLNNKRNKKKNVNNQTSSDVRSVTDPKIHTHTSDVRVTSDVGANLVYKLCCCQPVRLFCMHCCCPWGHILVWLAYKNRPFFMYVDTFLTRQILLSHFFQKHSCSFV